MENIFFYGNDLFIWMILNKLLKNSLLQLQANTINSRGIWAQIQITYVLLSPLVAMQLNLAIVKYLSGEADKAKRRQVLGAMLLAISVLSIIFLLLTNLLASQLSVFLFDNVKYSSFVRLTALWVVVSAYFSFFISYMRARSKIILLSIQQIIGHCIHTSDAKY